MKFIKIIILFVISTSAIASEVKQIKSLMQDYLKALDKNSISKIKSITSEKYFKSLSKNGILQKTFELNKETKKSALK